MPLNTIHKPLIRQQLLASASAWETATCPQASVLLLLCPEPSAAFTLLTLRAEALPLHAGQISFPGGRREVDDPSPEATALRESREEIGLPETLVELLGRLPQVIVSSGIMITPVVGWCEALPPLVPNPSEVTALIKLPLSLALNPAIYGRTEKISDTGRREFLYLEHENHYVWGATATILHSLAHALASLHPL